MVHRETCEADMHRPRIRTNNVMPILLGRYKERGCCLDLDDPFRRQVAFISEQKSMRNYAWKKWLFLADDESVSLEGPQNALKMENG